MRDVQLEKMSVKDLLALQVDLEAALIERKQAERNDVKEKLAALAEKSGFSVDELFGKARKNGAGSRGTVAPKYRNPQNASETWTGRGRMPLWMKALTEKGAKREKFLIK